MIKKTILLFCLCVFLAASCVPVSAPTAEDVMPQNTVLPATPTQESIQNATDDQCIPPIANWELAMEPPRSITPVPVVSLPLEWKFQTSLPEKYPEARLALIEHHQDYDVIWVWDWGYTSGGKYFRYRTNTGQWSAASFESAGNEAENDYPLWLFQDQNGKIWGLASSGYGQYLRFLRLNDNDQFELINEPGIHGSRISDLDQIPLVRKDNTFWFLAYDSPTRMSLFSFDPNTGEAKAHLSGEFSDDFPYVFGRSIAIGQDGSILLMRLKDDVVIRYDPDVGTSEDIVTYSLRSFHSDFFNSIGPDLFVDQAGILWIGDYAWIDFRNLTIDGYPTLHQIIRSPLFITTGLNDISTFQWVRPRPMLQSSDGRIWFGGGAAGLVWLDPQKGIWCKFTTIDPTSNILEDSDGNLWLLYDSNLYKYAIAP